MLDQKLHFSNKAKKYVDTLKIAEKQNYGNHRAYKKSICKAICK